MSDVDDDGMIGEDEIDDEDDDGPLPTSDPSQIAPIVDVLQIDNELSSPKYRFEKNEIMLCYHGLLLYEVKCVDQKMKDINNASGHFYRPSYLVHYCGWSSKWDEWVDETRLIKRDEIGLKKQTQLLVEHGKGKVRLKNLRKNSTNNLNNSPVKRTTSRSISDYSTSTSTNLDTAINETTNHGLHFGNEETPSLSDRSDTGSSTSTSSNSEIMSNTDLTSNELGEPDLKKFKRTSKMTSKDKKPDIGITSMELSPLISTQYDTCQRLTRRFYTYQMEWLKFPADLVEILVNDRDYINNQNYLISIPPTKSSLIIRQIFDNYLQEQINECSLAEVLASRTLISSFIDMFNMALGKCLLYRFERLQLRQLLEQQQSSTLSLCDVYGSLHLLRFMWRIKDLLREMTANINRDEFGLLLGRIQHFLNYLYQHKTVLFDSKEYDICSTEYYRYSLQCFQ